jgi:4-carboxymuconolactone decarboxylase
MNDQKPRGEKFERGLTVRRSVLGDAYVDQSLKAATDFDWPIQKLATEYCWDEIWNRPGLDRRSRSLLNLGMIAALNRPKELKAHIRGALNNGLTRDELAEVFLQSAIYLRLPAALDSFRLAKEVFEEMGLGD